jgi:hypothetical protein
MKGNAMRHFVLSIMMLVFIATFAKADEAAKPSGNGGYLMGSAPATPVAVQETATPQGNQGYVYKAPAEKQEEHVKFKNGPETQVKGWIRQVKETDEWIQENWW